MVETDEYVKEVLEMKDRIQFAKKIRTIYINGKTLSDLHEALDLMLKKNYVKHRIHGNSYGYTIGSQIYLIDIRYNTYYKSKKTFPNHKDQWFGPENLKKLFKQNKNIKYRYCQALGNPEKIRKHYKNNPDKQKKLYLKYLQTNHKDQNSRSQFERLFAIAIHKKPLFQICLMCYCEPKKKVCHRFWLREALIQKYFEKHNLGHAPDLEHYYKIDNKMNF